MPAKLLQSYGVPVLSLRRMTEEDLPAVRARLGLPHVARWWAAYATPEQDVAKYRGRIRGTSGGPTVMLTITWGDDAIGWCQWYRWDSPLATYRLPAANSG